MQARQVSRTGWMIFAALALGLPGLVEAANPDPSGPDGYEAVFEPIIEIDLRQDTGQARRTGRYVMIMFTKEGCSPCERMKQDVLTDPDVQTYFTKNFLSYHVNIFGDLPIIDADGVTLTEKRYAAREGIWGTPEFRFYGENGKLLYRHRGALSKNDFLRLGQFIGARQYRSGEVFTRREPSF